MKKVIYCDDQERFRKQFQVNHEAHYDIELIEDIGSLAKAVSRRKELPDIILIDLYHPKGDSPEILQKVSAAEQQLKNLDDQIDATRQAVLDAWNPTGLEALKQLREKYPHEKLPIVLYTQKGLLLLNDRELRDAQMNGADWLLKNKMDPQTERIWIDRIIHQNCAGQSTKTDRFFHFSLIVSWLLVGLLVSRLVFSGNDIRTLLANALGAAVGGIAAYFIPSLIRLINK